MSVQEVTDCVVVVVVVVVVIHFDARRHVFYDVLLKCHVSLRSVDDDMFGGLLTFVLLLLTMQVYKKNPDVSTLPTYKYLQRRHAVPQ